MAALEDIINKAKVSNTDMLVQTVGAVAALDSKVNVLFDVMVRVLANQEGKTEDEIREDLQPLIKERFQESKDSMEEWGLKNSI